MEGGSYFNIWNKKEKNYVNKQQKIHIMAIRINEFFIISDSINRINFIGSFSPPLIRDNGLGVEIIWILLLLNGKFEIKKKGKIIF